MLRRFSWHQRIAHFVGSIAGMMLLLTGLPIMFPQQLNWLTTLLGGSGVTMLLHRTFAIVLIFSFSYFGIYFILERAVKGRGDSNIKNLGFSASFISEIVTGAVKDILWTLGLRKERAEFGKYDWIMAGDIFLLSILAFAEIVTGTIMWFPRSFPFIVSNPGLFFAIRTLHAGIAFFILLFVLAHAGILHLTPLNFPINMSIFTGLIPKKIANMYDLQKWILLAEQIEGKEIEKRANPLCYILGGITIANIIALAYIPFIMRSEWLAGLRISSDGIATFGLDLAIITLITYILVSIGAFLKGIKSSS